MNRGNNELIYKRLFYYIVLTLSISLAFAQGYEDDRNYILIGSMFFGPIILLTSFSKPIEVDKKIGYFMLLFFLIPILFCFHKVKWSSFFFTFMFLFYFLAGVHCAIKGDVEIKNIKVITERIIYAYAIVLILQQLCVLGGFPVINGSALNDSEPWKLNSLSAEPSHTSRLIGIAMYAFIYCQGVLSKQRLTLSTSFKTAPKVWLAFLWVSLTTVSGTAMLVVIVIFLMFYSKKSLPVIIVMLLLFLTIGVVSDITALKRASTFVDALFTGDTSSIIGADHSASVRVVPWVLCLQHINIFSFRSWVGEGGGSVADWISSLMPGVPDDFNGGGSANLIVERGLIIGVYYLILSFKLCFSRNFKLSSVGFWILCIVLEGINMQMAWFCMLMLYIVKYMGSKYQNNALDKTEN